MRRARDGDGQVRMGNSLELEFGSGSMSPFREISLFTARKSDLRQIRRYCIHIARGSGAQRPGYRPTRVTFTRCFRAVRVRHMQAYGQI
jgi:hypothetical protein